MDEKLILNDEMTKPDERTKKIPPQPVPDEEELIKIEPEEELIKIKPEEDQPKSLKPGKEKKVITKDVEEKMETIIKELEEQIASLTSEKESQEKAAEQAKKLLQNKIEEDEQRKSDWDQKQKQLQDAQRIAQQLIEEKNKEDAKELAKFSNCDELQSECTNLRGIYASLSSATTQITESFGHELLEIQYLFSQKLNDIETLLTPIKQNSAGIESDAAQAKSQLMQLARIIEQLQNLHNKKKSGDSAVETNSKITQTVDNLATLHKTLVQLQVQQRKLQDKEDVLRERFKKSKPAGTLEMTIAIVLGLQLLFQLIQFISTRKHNRRRRLGGPLVF